MHRPAFVGIYPNIFDAQNRNDSTLQKCAAMTLDLTAFLRVIAGGDQLLRL